MGETYSPYVMKLVETIERMDSRSALRFIEQMEKMDTDELLEFIETMYEGKDHLPDVLNQPASSLQPSLFAFDPEEN